MCCAITKKKKKIGSSENVKEEIVLTLVEMVKKTLCKTVLIGVKTTAVWETDGVQFQIQQRQGWGIFSQGGGGGSQWIETY